MMMMMMMALLVGVRGKNELGGGGGKATRTFGGCNVIFASKEEFREGIAFGGDLEDGKEKEGVVERRGRKRHHQTKKGIFFLNALFFA